MEKGGKQTHAAHQTPNDTASHNHRNSRATPSVASLGVWQELEVIGHNALTVGVVGHE